MTASGFSLSREARGGEAAVGATEGRQHCLLLYEPVIGTHFLQTNKHLKRLRLEVFMLIHVSAVLYDAHRRINLLLKI